MSIELKTILESNPVTTALASGMYLLFYDPPIEKWVVMRGIGRGRRPIIETNDFEAAFSQWVKSTGQNYAP